MNNYEKLRMLKGFYRKPPIGVKPNYPSFSILPAKVINKVYLNEFIQNNIINGLMVLKPTI